MITFIGVRISWLMLARKADLACAASSATSRAATSSRLSVCRSACARLDAVMSEASTKKPRTSPRCTSGMYCTCQMPRRPSALTSSLSNFCGAPASAACEYARRSGERVLAEDLRRRLAQHLVERLAEPFAVDAVGEAAALLAVPVGDAHRQVVGDAARERLGLDQLGVELLQPALAAPHLGDVGGDEEVAADVAVDDVGQPVDPEVADAARRRRASRPACPSPRRAAPWRSRPRRTAASRRPPTSRPSRPSTSSRVLPNQLSHARLANCSLRSRST